MSCSLSAAIGVSKAAGTTLRAMLDEVLHHVCAEGVATQRLRVNEEPLREALRLGHRATPEELLDDAATVAVARGLEDEAGPREELVDDELALLR